MRTPGIISNQQLKKYYKQSAAEEHDQKQNAKTQKSSDKKPELH